MADTYLLESLTFDDVTRIHQKHPQFFEANLSTGHGLLVAAEKPNGGAYRIVRVLPGDNSDIVRGWLDGSGVDLLVRHFETSPPTSAAKEAAVDRWKKARVHHEEVRRRATELARARRQVLEELDAAKREDDEASRDLVRTHGRRLWVDGVQWEVVSKKELTGERIYYRRKFIREKFKK